MSTELLVVLLLAAALCGALLCIQRPTIVVSDRRSTKGCFSAVAWVLALTGALTVLLWIGGRS